MGKTIAAGIFIIRDDKKVLICHPTNHKPDFWSIPKGKVEEGETMIQAAIRETYEETNINLVEFTMMKDLEPVNYGHKKKMLYPFICWEGCNPTIDWNSFDIKCNSNVPIERGGFPEMDEYKWVTLDEAKPLLHETQAACIDIIKDFINSDEYNGKFKGINEDKCV